MVEVYRVSTIQKRNDATDSRKTDVHEGSFFACSFVRQAANHSARQATPKATFSAAHITAIIYAKKAPHLASFI